MRNDDMSDDVSTSDTSSLVLPGQQPPDAASLDGLPTIVWLRNPKTGVINKFQRPMHDDTIARCLKDGHTHSSERAAQAQAVELARLQGRALPSWASEASATAAAVASGGNKR